MWDILIIKTNRKSKKKIDRKFIEWWWWRSYHLRQARKDFTKKVTSGYRRKGDEGASLVGVQGKKIPRKRTSAKALRQESI